MVRQMTDRKATNLVDKHLGARLRLRRLEMGMSQERLGEVLGITFQQVQKYEKGLNRIAASRLYEIASVLKVSVSAFFDGLVSEPPNPATGFAETGAPMRYDVPLTREAQIMVELLDHIHDEARRRMLMEFARNLATIDAASA